MVIAYQGVIAPEAIKAAGIIGEGRRDTGVLAVTSAGTGFMRAGPPHNARVPGVSRKLSATSKN